MTNSVELIMKSSLSDSDESASPVEIRDVSFLCTGDLASTNRKKRNHFQITFLGNKLIATLSNFRKFYVPNVGILNSAVFGIHPSSSDSEKFPKPESKQELSFVFGIGI